MDKANTSLKSNIKTFYWSAKLAFSFSKKIYTVLIIVNVFIELIPILITYIGAQIINILATSGVTFTSELATLLFIGFLLSVSINILNDIQKYCIIKFNYDWDIKAWELFLGKTANLDFQYLESPDYSIFMHRVKEAVNWRGNNIAHYVPELISSFLSLLLIGGIFLTLNPLFIVLTVSIEVLRFLINRKFGNSLYSFWDSEGDAKNHAWYAQHALENSDVLKESKIYNFSKIIIGRYKTEVGRFNQKAIRNLKGRTLFRALIGVLDAAVFLVIQVWIIGQVIAKTIDLGGYTFYLSNISMVSRSLNNLQGTLSWFSEQLPFMTDFKKYLALEDLVLKRKDGVKVENTIPEIEFKDVSFKYPGTEKFVLENLSFKINAGEKVAIIGENGAGKTTLIKLLARFYDVTSGEILINGINIKDLDLQSYYKLWGVLFQSFAKLWFSIRENIGVGNTEDIDRHDLIVDAAAKADSKEFIEQLPNKFETLLSRDFEGGIELSGGQWQKLGIARSIFANPKLIILDEPTSALDALAEAEVFENINKLSKDATVIVISHRFATVRNANRIIVLKDHKILEQGTHEELLNNDKLYAQMFNEQAKGYL